MPNPNGNTSNLKHYQPKWNSGKTRTIRVPVVLAEQVLEYAHQLDSNDSPDTSDSDGKRNGSNDNEPLDTSEITEFQNRDNPANSLDTSGSVNILDREKPADSPDTSESGLEQIARAVLSDPAVTRDGKDRGAAKRAVNAFIARLKSSQH